jgi:GNAT superfamily N-acetyltransferase
MTDFTITDFTIDELSIPATLDSPDAAPFIATIEVRNAVEADGYGTNEFAQTAAEILPTWLDEFEPKRLFAATVDGRIVARGIFETRTGENPREAWFGVQVLPEFRGRGIGTALADRLEGLATSESRDKLISYVPFQDAEGERMTSPTGFGSVPLDIPQVRFLLGRDYTLEQVERGSRLRFPIDRAASEAQLSDALTAAGPDYRVHRWIGFTPEQWLADMADLFTLMSTDEPTAGLEEPEDVWTVDRLRASEQRRSSSPRDFLVAVVEHVPSETLVGMTEVSVPEQLERPLAQNDTIVARAHRGHRLGTVLKVANLLHVDDVRPGHPSIITFNAEENRHMLDVNEVVGFVPMGYEGAWKKVLPTP